MAAAESRPAVSLPAELRAPDPRPRLTLVPDVTSGVSSALPRAILNHAPRPRPAPAPRLRLTRRGRMVVAGAAALLIAVGVPATVLGIGAGSAQATGHAMARSQAERNLAQVTVRRGQSLWSVAEASDPGADPRVVIQQIIELNALSGTTVLPGERLWVPRE